MASWQEMPSEAEEIVEWAMDRKRPLGLPRGFESAHLTFSVARRLVRDFRSVVSTAVLAVADARQELSASSAITAKAIGHNQTGSVGQSF
jgi:hypothetical protein